MAAITALLAPLFVSSVLVPAAFADVDVRLDMGHGGGWVDDAGTPVFVELRNSGRDTVVVSLALVDADRFSSGTYRHLRSVALGPGATRREAFLVPGPTTYSSPLSVRLQTDPPATIRAGGEAFTRGVAQVGVTDEMTSGGRMPLAARVIGVLAEGGARAFADPFRRASGVFVENDASDSVEVLSVDPGVLPFAPLALVGLDALVVVAPPPGFLTDERAREGLLDWVALGGRLVLASPEDLSALARGPLGAHLPADAAAITRGRYAGFLQAHARVYTDETRPKVDPRSSTGPLAELRPRPGGEAAGVPVARGTGGLSRVERRFGQGSIVVLAYDLRPALHAADVRGGHYAQCLATEVCGRPSPLASEQARERVGQFGMGFDDQVDQALQNVLAFGAFQAPPLFLVLGALILYVLAVGPLDYLLLKRLGKQRLTTLTFAASVLLFTALAYGASFLVFAKGAVVNRIVFVDYVDVPGAGRALAQARDVAGYYSPVGAATELRFPLPAVIGSSGLPGSLSTGDVGRSLPITITGGVPTEPHGLVEVAFRSQRNVCTHLAGPVGRTVDVSVTRASGEGLSAEVTNGLPVALTNAWLVRPGGEGAFHLGAFEPGESRLITLTARGPAPGDGWDSDRIEAGDDDAAFALGAFLSRVGPGGLDDRAPGRNRPQVIATDRAVHMAKSGVGHGAALARGRALLIAFAAAPPFPLPADDADGRKIIVVRKEVDLP